ncbi:ORF1318 [White spot syndrome virus]|uniref:Wsv472 n=3 Tax=White spot syndrome virus TaxID=342409 RepID=Q8VAE8_WSSVS|nr:wsv472 [Shrimp white spot syndrome virus]AFX59846.1 wsv472 [White spot syndrome virus]AAL33473.1 wsv472 [Shrimp white spot syndrome virus]AAL89399.1 WSSV531 [Shrimp white spot syndrome virus]ATU84024.1 ORF1318 [White spot syndrome virus]AWQ60590.1 wsv472 [Shrimp white spot syndrome virus]
MSSLKIDPVYTYERQLTSHERGIKAACGGTSAYSCRDRFLPSTSTSTIKIYYNVGPYPFKRFFHHEQEF